MITGERRLSPPPGVAVVHHSKIGSPTSALGQKRTSRWSAPLGLDSFMRRGRCPLSAKPHREWSCYPEVTPYEFLSAMEIEARAATKRSPKPSTQNRSGLGSWLPQASKLGASIQGGIFLCNGHPPFVPH